MARAKKKPDAAATDAAPAPTAEIVPIKPAEPGVVLSETGKKRVVWSTMGEKKGAFALGSKHKAGDALEVSAADAERLIARGFAKALS